MLFVKKRRDIYHYIKNNPGSHQREISRKLDIPYSTLYYHLNYLKKQDLISEKQNKGYSRYYVKNSVGRVDKKVIDLLRQKIPRSILVFLLFSYVSTEKHLSENLDRHPTTIKHHLKKLLDLDIIEYAPVENGEIDNKLSTKTPIILRRPIKNEKLYRIKNRAFVEKAMDICWKDLKKDEGFKSVCEIVWYFKRNHGVPKKINPFEKNVSKAIDKIFDIFPFPWCA